MRPETLAARMDGFTCSQTGAIIPPIQMSSTFARGADYVQIGDRGYSRDENPTYEPVERIVAQLEEGVQARLFASGMAAITTLFQALRPGDHVVVSATQYFGVLKWLRQWAAPWGLEISYVDTGDLDQLSAAMREGQTKLVYLESPANPTWRVTDIAAAGEIAHASGAMLAVDNTVATPVLTRPLALGADIVVHSATKYLNGHSDLVAGILVTAVETPLWSRINEIRYLAGPVLGAFEAWLLLRGMRTLFVRVAQSCATAMTLATHFAAHDRVAEVLYPGLPSFDGHEIARRQMTGGFGAMLSIRVKGGEAAALAAIGKVSVFIRATSLGGVESLIEHRFTVEGADTVAPPDLLRISIGLEAAEDLINDLEQALQA